MYLDTLLFILVNVKLLKLIIALLFLIRIIHKLIIFRNKILIIELKRILLFFLSFFLKILLILVILKLLSLIK